MSDVNEVINPDDTASQKAADSHQNSMKIYAGNLHQSDVYAMISEVDDAGQSALHDLSLVACGYDYQRARDSLNLLVEKLKSGGHRDFARRNDFLGDPRLRKDFIDKDSEDQTRDERELLAGFYDVSTSSSKLVNTFSKYIQFISDQVLQNACYVIGYDITMSGAYSSEDLNKIKMAFGEYETIFKRYNQSGIYKELDVSKKYSFEENYETVLDHMDSALAGTGCLCEFLLNTKQTAAYQTNRLHCLDRATHEFGKYNDKESTFKRALDQTRELAGNVPVLSATYRNKINQFYDGMNNVLDEMDKILEKTLNILKQFNENTSEMPYAILHYDPIVKAVAGNYLSMSLADPVKEGTRYNEMAGRLLQRFRELAKSVAKLAP